MKEMSRDTHYKKYIFSGEDVQEMVRRNLRELNKERKANRISRNLAQLAEERSGSPVVIQE
jgi:hypothetical protein